MMNYACDFIQSKMEKYFEWIIMTIIVLLPPLLSIDKSQKKQGSVVLWTSEIQGAYSIMISMKKT